MCDLSLGPERRLASKGSVMKKILIAGIAAFILTGAGAGILIAADSDATAGYKKAMDGMMAGMMTPYTGNADVDFVAGMIPHHQGAVDMAKVVLQFGKDPEVKKFAEGVISAQEAEIKWMSEWLAKNGPKK
jgi:uncharacterized protein (DUF305 family)